MRVRIIQDEFNGNRWQAQYKESADEPWFDIGDAKETYDEAEANRDEFIEHRRMNPK